MIKDKENKKIGFMLNELKTLFSSWGIKTNDWILALHYAEILQGYKVKKSLRAGHLNILIKSSKLPWSVKKNLLRIETTMPIKSVYYKQYRRFQKKVGFDFDLMPYSKEDFNFLLQNYSVKYKFRSQLMPEVDIYLLSIEGSLFIIDEYLGKYFKEIGEKRKRIFTHLKEIKISAGKLKHLPTFNSAKNLIKKYQVVMETSSADKILSRDEEKIIGMVVFRSKKLIIGKVLVIKNAAKLFDVSLKKDKNFILVCSRLIQKMIPIVSNSLAIITDDGGILSHAAIISRELKIPCIVGTEYATKALKDRDLVEVDANKGIIRKLK